MHCLMCNKYIPTMSWRNFVSDETFNTYYRNARDLLSVRCAGCDSIQSLFVEELSQEERLTTAINFVNMCSDSIKLGSIYEEFLIGHASAEELLDSLEDAGPGSLRDSVSEERLAENGRAYTREAFLQHY